MTESRAVLTELGDLSVPLSHAGAPAPRSRTAGANLGRTARSICIGLVTVAELTQWAAAVAVGRCSSDPASQRRRGCGIVAGAALRQRHLLDREVGTCSPRHFVSCEVPLK